MDHPASKRAPNIRDGASSKSRTKVKVACATFFCDAHNLSSFMVASCTMTAKQGLPADLHLQAAPRAASIRAGHGRVSPEYMRSTTGGGIPAILILVTLFARDW